MFFIKKKVLIIGAILIFLITGCSNQKYSEDLNEEYKSYWEYALGNYICTEGTNVHSEAGGLSSTTYKTFTLTYKDKNGVQKKIYIDNYRRDFESIYQSILTEDFTNIIKDNFKGNNLFVLDDVYPVHVYVKKVNQEIAYQDDKKGVKIRELTANNFYNNNLSILIDIDINTVEDYEDVKAIQDKIKKDFNFLFKKYNSKGIYLVFNISSPNGKKECYGLDSKNKWDECYNKDGNYKWHDE